MRILRQLIGDDPDAGELFELARTVAPRLLGTRRPDDRHEGVDVGEGDMAVAVGVAGADRRAFARVADAVPVRAWLSALRRKRKVATGVVRCAARVGPRSPLARIVGQRAVVAGIAHAVAVGVLLVVRARQRKRKAIIGRRRGFHGRHSDPGAGHLRARYRRVTG